MNFVITTTGKVRRRDKRVWFMGLAVFVAVFLFVFLMQRFKGIDGVEAANLAEFDAGYIISDYQMGNYNSMSEAEIQAFLTAKNPCDNTDYGYYQRLSGNYNYKWHFENGHFICLSEERFGDGDNEIGFQYGESAAHIIWQAAQDYKINPQVLLVLLQKETGLITDRIPNNGDYRKATGYGCPDTAACSSKYYGFKNQVRNAAALYRYVLDNGSRYYPTGNNYVQYNPNSGCGGSVVNIKNRATSALYQYTPYQPNSSALAAGYGAGDGCAAYGNRNFYLYFEDWFGNISSDGKLGAFSDMVVPRLFYVKAGSRYIDPWNSTIRARTFSSFEYFTHLNHFKDTLCLSIGNNRNCYIYSDLEELKFGETEEMVNRRMLTVSKDTTYLDVKKNVMGSKVVGGDRIIFNKKIYVNGQLCLQTDEDAKVGRCIPYSELEELPDSRIVNMTIPREIYVKKNVEVINLDNGISEKIAGGEKVYFTGRSDWFGELCLQRQTDSGSKKCILYNNLREILKADFSDMTVPRFMKIKAGVQVISVSTGESSGSIKDDTIAFFNKKMDVDGKLCLQGSDEKLTNEDTCILYDSLEEIVNFSKMVVPRDILIKGGTKYQGLNNGEQYSSVVNSTKLYFVDKISMGGELCLRSKVDAEQNLYRCIKYSDLIEQF